MMARKQWMVWLGWVVVGFGVLLSLALTAAQREKKEWLESMPQERFVSPFPNLRSSLFHLQTHSPLSRSRQGSEWRQDLVWAQTALKGYSVAFSPDGQFLATTASSGFIQIYRVSNGNLYKTLKGHNIDNVYSIAFPLMDNF